MTTQPIIVVGASRGFGAATTRRLADDGHHVVAVARDSAHLSELAAGNSQVTSVAGDARDTALAVDLLATFDPVAVLIGGGSAPHMAPLEDQTWETLSLNWHNDVALAFTWLHAILNNPTEHLKHVVVISSGAGLFGSPGSGGYAGSKATTRFLTASAADSAKRLRRNTKYTTVNPKLTSDTDTGRAAVAGYARINGGDVDSALAAPPLFTADHAGVHLALLVGGHETFAADHYLLTEAGLVEV